MSKYLISLSSLGKRFMESEVVRIIGQLLFVIAIFASLYLLLLAGFAAGIPM